MSGYIFLVHYFHSFSIIEVMNNLYLTEIIYILNDNKKGFLNSVNNILFKFTSALKIA